MVAGFGKSKKDILKFVKINSCSISSQNILKINSWSISSQNIVTFVEISQFFLWKRNMILLTKFFWISILTSLQRRQIEKYVPLKSVRSRVRSIFKITSNRLISKKYIANLVKHQKHCSYQNFFFVVAFSFKCIVEFFFSDLIAKLFALVLFGSFKTCCFCIHAILRR